MKKSLIIFIIALTFAGCTTVNNKAMIPEVKFPLFLPNMKADYDILAPVETKSCSTFHALWPIPIFWYEGPENPQEDAYQKLALASGGDAIVSPIIRREIKKIFPWYKEECVIIRGKPLRIKGQTTVTDTGIKYYKN
ncbi:MAG: hypothetical protein GX445_02830 [Elusimicrobia bacterium]|nr:hypothetical protein [Elusimicrobiota bacterium]